MVEQHWVVNTSEVSKELSSAASAHSGVVFTQQSAQKVLLIASHRKVTGLFAMPDWSCDETLAVQ